MNTKMKFGIVVSLSVVLFGCERSSEVVPQPSKVTLESALVSVEKGLNEMVKAQEKVKFGLIPSEVTVTFNISASGEDSSKLYIEAGSVTAVGGTAKAGTEMGSKLHNERGNQITIKFTNLLLTEKGKYFYDKGPKIIKDALENQGVSFMK
ncbi:MAG: hypothetical protein NTW80_11760 [Deltaproteobacteria bacterium]|nr:hypothetical protein [Deltaproteobacteria bacterium]